MDQPTIEEVHKDESTPLRSETEKLHWLLKRNDDGEIVIRRGQVVRRLTLMNLSALGGAWLTSSLLGKPISVFLVVSICGWMSILFLVALNVSLRRSQGRPIWQFQLRNVLIAVTAFATLFALARLDRDKTLSYYAARQEIANDIERLVDGGSVTVSGNPGSTTIQVTRPTFDDDDLDKLLQLTDRLISLDAPITFLDLSGTQITDQGAAALASLGSLEYCFLDKTQVSDQAVDELQQLQHLRVFSVRNTAVSPERLKQLSIDRPDLDIEPKTYQVKRP